MNFNNYIEIIPNKYYWAIGKYQEKLNPKKCKCFNIDKKIKYIPIYSEYGPLNMNSIHQFVQNLKLQLNQNLKKDEFIVHQTNDYTQYIINNALLIGSFLIFELDKSDKEVEKIFELCLNKFIGYKDISVNENPFKITVQNCWSAIYFMKINQLFKILQFDRRFYNFYSQIQNGDMNWIIPNKILAFASPIQSSNKQENSFLSLNDYNVIFKKLNIKIIIRLNNKTYDENFFQQQGYEFYDFQYPDGSCPSDEQIYDFLQITQKFKFPFAIHCRAGLGRTGTMISLYLMAFYGMTAREAISWCRIMRKGSVIGCQQQFLVDKQKEMQQQYQRIKNGQPLIFIQNEEKEQHKYVEDKNQGKILVKRKTIFNQFKIYFITKNVQQYNDF